MKLEGLGEIWGKVGTWGIRWNLRHFGETGEKGETGEIPLHLKGEHLGIWWSLNLNNKEKRSEGKCRAWTWSVEIYRVAGGKNLDLKFKFYLIHRKTTNNYEELSIIFKH